MIALALGGAASAGELVLLPSGGTWRYLDTGVDPGPGWEQPGFDDSAWATGPSPLGYGLPALGTTVSSGPDPQARYPTAWFRTTFVEPDPSALEAFSLALRRDDGAAVYVNGVEVLRTNLAPGATASSYALTGVYGADQDAFVPVALPPGVVVAGTNVVAVEVHNQSASSTDLVMDATVSGWDGPTRVVRGPWLQQPTPTSVIVRWTTDGPGAGRLWWGAAPGALDRSADDGVVGFDHAVRVDGWTPGTDLAYAVGHPTAGVLEGDDAQHVLRTPPRVGSRAPVRIWAIGDSGTADANAEAVRDAYAAYSPDPLDTDVWLMLGDNAYGSGTLAEYDAAVFGTFHDLLRQVPLWATLGNHDGYSSFSATETGPYFDLFSWPTAGECGGEPSGTEAYWSFDHGNVHVVDLDSTDSDRSATGPMATWLRADLAAAAGADWIVAVFHHPIYSKGSHDSDLEPSSVEMRENLLPILEDGGVDLVLNGHSHDYERSLLVDGFYGPSDALDPSMVLQDHDGDPAGDGPYTKWSPGVAPHQGTIAVVAGSSGEVSGGTLDHPVMQVSLATLGSLVLDVDGLSLQGRFLDDQGAILDTFEVDKGVTTLVRLDGDTLGLPGELLSFEALAIERDGTPVGTYAWDWGDGSPGSSGATASHAWAAEGEYTLTVTATDSHGTVVRDTLLVGVDVGPPVIDDHYAAPGALEGTPVTLTAVASDPAGDPLTYAWDVEGQPLTGDVVDATFWDEGTHSATVTVTDDAGRTATADLQVDVANAPPALVSLDAGSPVEGSPASLRANVRDPGFDPVTVSWDWGGGDVQTGVVVTHTFGEPGAVPVTLTLSDDDGAETVLRETIEVANVDPTLDDLAVEGDLVEGSVLAFHVTAADPGTAEALTVTWDFGDGSPKQSGEDVEHAFPDQGPWTVHAFADDGDGGLAWRALDVALADAPPVIGALAVPTELGEGAARSFRVESSDPGAADVLTVTWRFGDGATARGAEVEHAFAREGTYEVEVAVADDEGEQATGHATVQVLNAPPVFLSEPERLMVEPGGTFEYAVRVRDVDPVDLRVEQPRDASVEDGVVTWVAPRGAGQEVPFRLVAADDQGAEAEQAFTVVIAEREGGPAVRLDRRDAVGCGCGSVGGAGRGWLWIGVLAWRRRRTG